MERVERESMNKKLGGEKKKMKTKNKVIALVEIAVVLCSVFLLAIPAIAADQTTQKASASGITTASEDDYVLGVYGNANEDDTINMGDVVYTKLAIFGKKPKTELCDAKYDGRINVLDVIQTKLIILGKEKELTVVDALEPSKGKLPEAVTVRKPVERIVVTHRDSAEVLLSLDATDKIVGVGKEIKADNVYFPELSKRPSIGGGRDYEAILNLHPDVVMPYLPYFLPDSKEKLLGVTTLYMGLIFPDQLPEGVRKLGYILDKEEEAKEYANWLEDLKNKIESRTEGLSEDEKPRVFHWRRGSSSKPGAYTTIGRVNEIHEMTVLAGGKDVSEDLLPYTAYWPKVDPEWVMEQNPDIIVVSSGTCGSYGMEYPSEMAAIREDILNLPELANVNAVKNKRVYMMDGHVLIYAPGNFVGIAYMAKWFQPELFEDLDPPAIHQEYIDKFQRVNYNLDEHGVFVYPPLE